MILIILFLTISIGWMGTLNHTLADNPPEETPCNTPNGDLELDCGGGGNNGPVSGDPSRLFCAPWFPWCN